MSHDSNHHDRSDIHPIEQIPWLVRIALLVVGSMALGAVAATIVLLVLADRVGS